MWFGTSSWRRWSSADVCKERKKPCNEEASVEPHPYLTRDFQAPLVESPPVGSHPSLPSSSCTPPPSCCSPALSTPSVKRWEALLDLGGWPKHGLFLFPSRPANGTAGEESHGLGGDDPVASTWASVSEPDGCVQRTVWTLYTLINQSILRKLKEVWDWWMGEALFDPMLRLWISFHPLGHLSPCHTPLLSELYFLLSHWEVRSLLGFTYH